MPAELRDEIYAAALTTQDIVSVIDAEGYKQSQPALLRTCRQIRQEALPVYYSSNSFRVVIQDNDTLPAITWLQSLADAQHGTYIPRLQVEITSLHPCRTVVEDTESGWHLLGRCIVLSGVPPSHTVLHSPSRVEGVFARWRCF